MKPGVLGRVRRIDRGYAWSDSYIRHDHVEIVWRNYFPHYSFDLTRHIRRELDASASRCAKIYGESAGIGLRKQFGAETRIHREADKKQNRNAAYDYSLVVKRFSSRRSGNRRQNAHRRD